MKRFYLYFILVFPIIWSNIRMTDDLPGASIFGVFKFLPKEIRIFEFGFIILFFLYAHFKFGRSNNFKIILPAIIFLTISFISSIINGVKISEWLQVTYMFLFPFLIISTTISFDYDHTTIEVIRKLYSYFVLLSIPAMTVGFFYFRSYDNVNPADVVNGFLRDANTSANFMFIVSFVELGFYFHSKINKHLYVAMIAFVMAFLGFNEKSTIFFVVLLILFLTIGKRLNIKIMFSILMVFTLLKSIEKLIINEEIGGQNSLIRIELLENINLTQIGPIKSYIKIPSALSESFIYPMFGSGPGTYSNPIVFSKYAKGEISSIAKKYNYEVIVASDNNSVGIQSALDWTVNIISGLIVEFGILCFICIFYLYRKLIKNLYYIFKKNGQYSFLALSILFSLVLLLITASLSNIANIDEITLMAPLSLYSGLLLTPTKIKLSTNII